MRAAISCFNYYAPGSAPKNHEKCSQYILLRMLLGTLTIEKDKHRIKQRTDYSKVTPVRQTKKNSDALNHFLSTETGHKSTKSFIKHALPSNRALYEDILLEFSNYFYQSSKGAHTAAFVFLYRALERLSFSVPLLYSAKSKDYYATFNDLKKLLEEGGQGELGLLKKFINQGHFIDKVILQINYDLDFSSSPLNGRHYFSVVNRLYGGLTDQDQNTLTAKIKMMNIHDFFITIRNRFFHSRTGDGQNNIRAAEINDSDDFFKHLNELFCSYISIITLYTISNMYMI